jgi:hypothetical protein
LAVRNSGDEDRKATLAAEKGFCLFRPPKLPGSPEVIFFSENFFRGAAIRRFFRWPFSGKSDGRANKVSSNQIPAAAPILRIYGKEGRRDRNFFGFGNIPREKSDFGKVVSRFLSIPPRRERESFV